MTELTSVSSFDNVQRKVIYEYEDITRGDDRGEALRWRIEEFDGSWLITEYDSYDGDWYTIRSIHNSFDTLEEAEDMLKIVIENRITSRT